MNVNERKCEDWLKQAGEAKKEANDSINDDTDTNGMEKYMEEGLDLSTEMSSNSLASATGLEQQKADITEWQKTCKIQCDMFLDTIKYHSLPSFTAKMEFIHEFQAFTKDFFHKCDRNAIGNCGRSATNAR